MSIFTSIPCTILYKFRLAIHTHKCARTHARAHTHTHTHTNVTF